MQVTVTVTNLDRVEQRLSRLGASLHDFTSALTILGRSLILFYSETNFISAGQALGSRWEPLKPSTDAYKSAHWPDRGILERTGTLKEGFYAENTRDTLFIGNEAPYFPYHQLGTAEGPGRGHNIPARKMLGVNPRVERLIKTVLQADIKAKIESTNV